MLGLYTEKKTRGKVVQIVDARSKISRLFVGLLEVSVRQGDEEPDAREDDPCHEEAAHEGQQSVPEKRTRMKRNIYHV